MRLNGKNTILLAGGVVLLGAVVARWMMSTKTEEPRFRSIGGEDGLEIREYEPQIVAETFVEGALRPSLNEGFGRLAGYIFGGNVRREKIAMTAPVGAQKGDKIAMTAPVGAQADGSRWRVTFTMPAGYTLSTLPVPNDPRVTLRAVPARRVAALRFSGWATEDAARDKTREALALLGRRGLVPASESVLAQYDPPWAIPFLRRNEILIDLANGAS